MKSIKLMFLMILTIVSFTSCDSEAEQNSELKQEKSYVWVEMKDVQKRQRLINVIENSLNGTECATCRACTTQSALGDNSWLVYCDDGTRNVVTNCGGGVWHVSDQTSSLAHGMTPVPYDCP